MTSCQLPISMDVSNVLHMNKGLGELSYANNSFLQKKSAETLKHVIIATAVEAYMSKMPPSLAMADLGCSSGANSLSMIGDIVKAISVKSREASKPEAEFMVFLNDLPANDFSTVFASFTEFTEGLRSSREGDDGEHPKVFLAAVPGSFYGRLFPKNSLNFVFSCYSLHWLSKVPAGLFDAEGKPLNKGRPYVSESSHPAVAIAYFKQFQEDFNLFLKSRSEELIAEGRIAITMLGRRTQDHQDNNTTFLWEVLAKSFGIMVSKGKVEEEKADSYNVPFYAPSSKEVEDEVLKEGSFKIDSLEVHEYSISSGDVKKDVKDLTMTVRAIQESMIKHHFGDDIVDPLFQIYGDLLSEAICKEELKGVHLVMALRKLS